MTASSSGMKTDELLEFERPLNNIKIDIQFTTEHNHDEHQFLDKLIKTK